MERSCDNCIYADQCQFKRPCGYYAPLNYKDRIDKMMEMVRMTRFYDEWGEYVKYWGEDNFFSSDID